MASLVTLRHSHQLEWGDRPLKASTPLPFEPAAFLRNCE
jgi:hypothetical protein